MNGDEQRREIETIRERTIRLKLSDADCERLLRIAGECGLTVGELIESFIGDLVDGTYTNGSDERMYAQQWMDRCWFSWINKNSFLNYLISLDFIEEFIEIYEDIREYEVFLESELPDKEQREFAESDLEYLKTRLKEFFGDYTDDIKDAESYEVSINRFSRWLQDRRQLTDNELNLL